MENCDLNLSIVVYMGGTCGDLLTAMLDCTDAEVCNVGKVDLPKQRQQLKKSYIFENDLAKLSKESDVYLEIDLSVTDIDKFKDVIDKFEHHEKLLEAIQLSLKDQTIRERNLQYMTRRLKHLITK